MRKNNGQSALLRLVEALVSAVGLVLVIMLVDNIFVDIWASITFVAVAGLLSGCFSDFKLWRSQRKDIVLGEV